MRTEDGASPPDVVSEMGQLSPGECGGRPQLGNLEPRDA